MKKKTIGLLIMLGGWLASFILAHAYKWIADQYEIALTGLSAALALMVICLPGLYGVSICYTYFKNSKVEKKA